MSQVPATWIGTLALLGLHIPLALGAWALSRRLTRCNAAAHCRSHDVVLAAQVYFACAVAIGILLGRVGLLAGGPVLVAGALGGLVMLGLGRTHAAWPRFRRPTTRPMWLTLAALAAVILATAWRALASPTYEYDVLTYHLFVPARWIQDAAVSIIPTWFGDPAPAYAPSATEVYYALLMLPFGEDVVARGGQFPFWILLLAASWGLVRELGGRRAACCGAALALALIPSINEQASTAMVDVALAAHVAAVALFAMRLARSGRHADAVGLALSIGLALGTKFIAIAYLAGLAPLVAFAVMRSMRGPPRPTNRLAIAASILLAVCIGGSWYARNWVVTDNPVYPLEARIGSTVLFPGAYGRAQMENSTYNTRRRVRSDAFGYTVWPALHGRDRDAPRPDADGVTGAYRRWYLGPAGLIVLTFAAAGVAAVRRRRRPAQDTLYYLGAAGGMAVFWYLLPFQQPRFAWTPLALMIIGAAAATRIHRVAPAILGLATLGTWAVAFSPDWAGAARAIRGGDLRQRAMADRRTFGGDAWQWIDRNLHDATIAYTGNNLPYFLCGRRLENRVVYVPMQAPPDGRFHDFAATIETGSLRPPNTSEPAFDRFVMDPAVWIDNLRRLEVDYVLVTPLYRNMLVNIRHDLDGYPIERTWLDALCRAGDAGRRPVVGRVFPDSRAVLYRLNREVLDPSLAAELPSVRRIETDAIDALMRFGVDADGRLRHYPHAGPVIQQDRLRPVADRK